MKSRIPLYVLIAFIMIALASVWFLIPSKNREPLQSFPATIDRDCAPWDGAAFSVSIPVNDGAVINISIYQAPDIRLPVTFSFPDETMPDGNALLLLPVGLPEQLTGKVWFQRVEEGNSVEGRFNLTSERGGHFNGNFRAEWGDKVVYCG
jgi:hypothetical protein